MLLLLLLLLSFLNYFYYLLSSFSFFSFFFFRFFKISCGKLHFTSLHFTSFCFTLNAVDRTYIFNVDSFNLVFVVARVAFGLLMLLLFSLMATCNERVYLQTCNRVRTLFFRYNIRFNFSLFFSFSKLFSIS